MQILKKHWNKILIVMLSTFIIFIAFFYSLDIKGKELVDKSFNESVTVFGSSKALNAAISLAQGTELDLPFVTISIGEVLDPINDLVEQFSWVMLASMVSLGIQKILLNFVTTDGYNIVLALFLFAANIVFFYRFKKDEKIRIILLKIAVIVIFLRFFVPLMGLANEYAYKSFVKKDYDIAVLNQNILEVKENINEVTQQTLEKKEDTSFFGLGRLTEKFDSHYYDKKIEEYKIAVEKSSEYIVALIIAFLFQTIILPLFFLLIFYYGIRGIIYL